MKCTLKKVEYIEVDIDFQKIYDYIVNENNDTDIDYIYEVFGDNETYYLENVCGIDFDGQNIDTTDADNERFLDDIWSDFYTWMKEKKNK